LFDDISRFPFGRIRKSFENYAGTPLAKSDFLAIYAETTVELCYFATASMALIFGGFGFSGPR